MSLPIDLYYCMINNVWYARSYFATNKIASSPNDSSYRKKYMSKLLSILSLAVASVMAFSPVQAAEEVFNLKFQSSDNTGNTNFELKKEWAARVKAMSGGRLNIEMMPVNFVGKHTETLDAICRWPLLRL